MGGIVCLLTQPPRLVYWVPRSACSPAAANHRLWYAGQRIDDHHKPGVTMLHSVSWRVTVRSEVFKLQGKQSVRSWTTE